MKKQIFILVLAFFAISFSNAYGQVVVPAARPVDVTCLPSDALHPMAGTAYNYVVEVPTPTGTKSFQWFVTQDQNFITAGGLTANKEAVAGPHIAANTGGGYNDLAAGTATISLTWKSFSYDAAKPVFVVIQVKSTVAGSCSPNNLKVFRIEPVNAFTLDIANVGADKKTVSAYEASLDRCISPIVSATYDATAPGSVIYDFGSDSLYYVVTAANFSSSWMPYLKIVSGLDANQSITSVQYFRPSDATFATPVDMPLNTGVYSPATADSVKVLDASGVVGATGEGIVIRVIVKHSNGALKYEGIADETIVVAVDGKTQLSLATPLGDVHHSKTVGTAADCGLVDGFDNDLATQVIKARPDITATTMPTPGLLPVK
jgi:hypothetical protein